MPVLPATINDIDELLHLLNSAYRGEESKKGWTTEANLLKGNIRTDQESLEKLIHTPGAIFLKYINEESQIRGCVFLHKKDDKLYLGMLSVSPIVQAKGIGKELMIAAEKYAQQQDCVSIFMKVISVRDELIGWYERQGYYKTGEKELFPDDHRYGVPAFPLEFILMEKKIS